MSDDSRLEAIEAKLAHQEHIVAELSDVIYQQQTRLDGMQRSYDLLLQRYRELQDTVGGEESEEPPPHY